MNIVTDFSSTGYTGKFSTTSGDYTIAGNVTTNGDKAITQLSGIVTTTATSERVGQFSLFFSSATSSIQDAVVAAIKAARTAVDEDLDS